MYFTVHPPDQFSLVQQRQYEVAILTLRRRGITLQAIAEVEQLLSAFPIPDHRVEGREHGAMAGGQLTAGRGLQLRQRLVMQPHLAECFHVNRHHQPLFLPGRQQTR